MHTQWFIQLATYIPIATDCWSTPLRIEWGHSHQMYCTAHSKLVSLHTHSVWETICDARASRLWHGKVFAHFAKNTLPQIEIWPEVGTLTFDYPGIDPLNARASRLWHGKIFAHGQGYPGWPQHRENREFGSYFFQTGKTQGILLWHREKFWDTGKIFYFGTGRNLDTGKIIDCHC